MPKEHPLRIGFLIHDVSRLRRTLADKSLQPLGITRSQSWVLAYLSRHQGSGMSQTELSNEMNVGKVTLGGLVDRLEEKGYVQRKPDPVDRRTNRIYMTEAGSAIVKEMQAISEKVNAAILKGIPNQDVAITEKVLQQMKERLIELEGQDAAAKALKATGTGH